MPTTPSGCGIRRFLAGMNCSAVGIALRRHPFLQMFGGVLDFAEHQQGLGDRGLDLRAMAEIGRDRLLETGFVVRDHRAQPRQPVEPLGQRRRGRRPRQLEHAWKASSRARCAGLFSGLVHGVSPQESSFGRKAGLLRQFWQERARGGRFGPIKAGSAVIKSLKDRPRAFPKPPCIGTYPSHPRAFAQGCLLRKPPDGIDRRLRRWPARFGIVFEKARKGLSRGGAAR